MNLRNSISMRPTMLPPRTTENKQQSQSQQKLPQQPPPQPQQPAAEGDEEKFEICESTLLKLSGDLASLRDLRLIGVKISSGMERIEKLVPNLRSLNISFTDVKKMEGISKLKELQEAILCHNRFDEIRGLTDSKGLLQLDLSYNNITVIEGLSHLVRLNKLDLSGNRITLIQGIDGMKNLTRLALAENSIKKIDFFPQLSCLEELDLKSNLIDTVHPKLFENIKSLIDLNLSNNKIRSLDFLNALGNLERFSCSNNMIEKVILKGELENLEFLDLSGNDITEVRRFEEFFPCLYSVDVSNNFICIEDELSFAYDMESLCEMDFSDNPVCTGDFLEDFLRRHPQLDVVNKKVIHAAGFRFREEIQQVQQEIEQLDNQEKLLAIKDKLKNKTEEVAAAASKQNLDNKETKLDDGNQLTMAILKANGIKDLASLMLQIKKEEMADKIANQQFIAYCKHLNEEITLEEIRAEAEKRRQREVLGDEADLEEDKQQLSKTSTADQQDDEYEDVDSEKEDEEEEEEEEDHRREKPRQNKFLEHFKNYVTLKDEDDLTGFMTELTNDLGEVQAKFRAIKGDKHYKLQRSASVQLQQKQLPEDSDDELAEDSFQSSPTNRSTMSVSSRTSIGQRNYDKSNLIVLEKIRTPNSTHFRSTVGSSLGSIGSAVTISNTTGTGLGRGGSGLGLSGSLRKGLPLLPRNTILHKELKELKKNLNDNEYLRKIGVRGSKGNSTYEGEYDDGSSVASGSSGAKTLTGEQVFMLKPRGLSATQPLEVSLQKKEKPENIRTSIDESKWTTNPSKGIIYSNKNIKAKGRIIDATQLGGIPKKV